MKEMHLNLLKVHALRGMQVCHAFWIFRYCVSLADVSEDFTAAVGHKNPKLKSEAIKLLQVKGVAESQLNQQPPSTPQPCYQMLPLLFEAR